MVERKALLGLAAARSVPARQCGRSAPCTGVPWASEGSFDAGSCAATRCITILGPTAFGSGRVNGSAGCTKSGSVHDSGSGWREVSCSIPMAWGGEPCHPFCPGLGGCGDGALWGQTGLGGAAGGVGADDPSIAGRRNAREEAGLCSASTQKVCTVHTLLFVCPIIKAR